jgi:hypothetical protein
LLPLLAVRVLTDAVVSVLDVEDDDDDSEEDDDDEARVGVPDERVRRDARRSSSPNRKTGPAGRRHLGSRGAEGPLAQGGADATGSVAASSVMMVGGRRLLYEGGNGSPVLLGTDAGIGGETGEEGERDTRRLVGRRGAVVRNRCPLLADGGGCDRLRCRCCAEGAASGRDGGRGASTSPPHASSAGVFAIVWRRFNMIAVSMTAASQITDYAADPCCRFLDVQGMYESPRKARSSLAWKWKRIGYCPCYAM